MKKYLLVLFLLSLLSLSGCFISKKENKNEQPPVIETQNQESTVNKVEIFSGIEATVDDSSPSIFETMVTSGTNDDEQEQENFFEMIKSDQPQEEIINPFETN